MTDAKNPVKTLLPGWARAIECGSQYGAAATFLALGTAFLHDALFFWMVDERMLDYFTLSDHIQTAVRFVALVIGLMVVAIVGGFVLALIGAGFNQYREKWPRVFQWLPFLGTGLLCAYVAWVLITEWARVLNDEWYFTTPELVGVGLCLLLVVALMLGRRPRGGWTDHVVVEAVRAAPLASLAAIWFVLAIGTSYVSGSLASRGKALFGRPIVTKDVVSLENDNELTGNVIRIVDKGVILRDYGAGKIMFVPKERVRRVDRNLPR